MTVLPKFRSRDSYFRKYNPPDNDLIKRTFLSEWRTERSV